jgi:hypothetical protein
MRFCNHFYAVDEMNGKARVTNLLPFYWFDPTDTEAVA